MRCAAPFLAAIAALALLAPCPAHGQGCCTPGTSPLGGLTGRSLAMGAVELGVGSDDYDLRQAYEGATRTTDPAGRHSQVDRVLGWARLGLPGDAVLVVELPWESRMREQPQPLGAPGEQFRLTGRGIGDLATSVLIRALPRRSPAPWAVSVGVGVKWGTGSVTRSQDGLRLPVELQSGTGSNDPLVLLTAHRLWARGGVTLASLARFPREGRNSYRYGTETHAVLFGYWSPVAAWSIGGEARVRTAAGDHFLDLGRPSTGGRRVMVGPRGFASWAGTGLGVEAAFLWPVHQSLAGLQIGVDREIMVGLRWSARR